MGKSTFAYKDRVESGYPEMAELRQLICRQHFGGYDDRQRFVLYKVAAYLATLVGQGVTGTADALSKEIRARREVGKLFNYKLLELTSEDYVSGLLPAARFLSRELSQFELRLILTDHQYFGSPMPYYPSATDLSASMALLALELAGVQAGDSIASLCCGCGNLLQEAVDSKLALSDGYAADLDRDRALLTAMRMDACGVSFRVSNDDVLKGRSQFEYDHVFCAGPLGNMAVRLDGDGHYYPGGQGYAFLTPDDAPPAGPKDDIDHPFGAEWLFAKAASDHLRDGGTGVVIMTEGQVSNGRDARTRSYFVEHGLIRAVVALPSRWRYGLTTKCVALVLGKPEDGIRFVDASDLGRTDSGLTEFSNEDIDEVMTRMQADGPMSRRCSVDELRATLDWSLSPAARLYRAPELVNPHPISDLVYEHINYSVFRGYMLTRDEMDEALSEEPTSFRMLTIAGVRDGYIDEDLPYMTGVLPRSLGYMVLRPGDLVITRSGSPIRAVVAEVPEDVSIFPTGNLFVVRFDEWKMDPYFAAAYLNSPVGRKAIEQVSVGTKILSLPIKALRGFMMPCPDMETQRRKGEKYQKLLCEMNKRRREIDRLAAEADRVYLDA